MSAPIAGRAVRIRVAGGPEVLEIAELFTPPPGPGQVRVEVRAAALNRADLLQRRGLYPAPPGVPSEIPGLEFAGVVESIGDGVRDVRPGDRVMGIVGGGAMSTHLLASERELLRIGGRLCEVEAGAIPEAFVRAFDGLFIQGALRPFEAVLIHAVASGVGTAAIQLASAAGCVTVGTTRSASKLDRCRGLGLTHGIASPDGVFADQVSAALGGRGVDVVLDPVAGPSLAETWKTVSSRARHVVIGSMGGPATAVPTAVLLQKRLTLVGTVLRSRPAEEKAALARRFAAEALPMFESGHLKPVVESVLPMSEVRAAHARMEANDTAGKLVLAW